MKAKQALAAALRKAADKIDPPDKAKRGISLIPADIGKLDGFDRTGPLIPLPDVDWNRSGWGNYV